MSLTIVLAEVRLICLKHSLSRYKYSIISPNYQFINEYKIKLSQFNKHSNNNPNQYTSTPPQRYIIRNNPNHKNRHAKINVKISINQIHKLKYSFISPIPQDNFS